MTSPTSHDAQRVSREAEIYDNDELERDRLEAVMAYTQMGPARRRRDELIRAVHTRHTDTRVLEVGSQAWEAHYLKWNLKPTQLTCINISDRELDKGRQVAQAKGLPQPDDFLTHTAVRDPNEIFSFKFRDVNGKLVSSEDPEYKGKVVLAIVTGTWCPNCHDEAQYLVELDKQYRSRGLRIVALDFEEVEQQDSLKRVHAFVKQYGVKYPYLIAGAPEEMWEKVPQLVNLNTWPATVFVGRDGTVRAVHAGFASPSTGDFYANQDKEFRSRIEQLLAEKKPATTRVASSD